MAPLASPYTVANADAEAATFVALDVRLDVMQFPEIDAALTFPPIDASPVTARDVAVSVLYDPVTRPESVGVFFERYMLPRYRCYIKK